MYMYMFNDWMHDYNYDNCMYNCSGIIAILTIAMDTSIAATTTIVATTTTYFYFYH